MLTGPPLRFARLVRSLTLTASVTIYQTTFGGFGALTLPINLSQRFKIRKFTHCELGHQNN